ncbi:MAG: CDP-alcohol phosphatidyltransferase family protein [Patescibacteria group bacterium]|nr:CDP-alcohol phosphatidyltransferase family protein [Patescibacteria group bacterium]
MPTKNFQNKLDKIIEKTFLWAIPKDIKPNHLTFLRFALLPVIYYLLANGNYGWGLLVFVIAASTDFLDGALARSRNQITDLGKVIDPIADKLLIGLALYFFGFEYLVVKIFLVVITFEIIANLTSGFAYRFIGRPVGANVFGKIKMVLQSIAIFIFLLGLLTNLDILVWFSEWVLIFALLFALLAGIEQSRIKLRKIREKRK